MHSGLVSWLGLLLSRIQKKGQGRPRLAEYPLTSESFQSEAWSIQKRGPPIQTLDNAGGQLGQPLEYLHSQAATITCGGRQEGEVGQAIGMAVSGPQFSQESGNTKQGPCLT